MNLENLNDKSFTLDGIPHTKVYELKKSIDDSFSLVSIFNRADALFSNQPLENISIEGMNYESVADLMLAFEPLKGNFNSGEATPQQYLFFENELGIILRKDAFGKIIIRNRENLFLNSNSYHRLYETVLITLKDKLAMLDDINNTYLVIQLLNNLIDVITNVLNSSNEYTGVGKAESANDFVCQYLLSTAKQFDSIYFNSKYILEKSPFDYETYNGVIETSEHIYINEESQNTMMAFYTIYKISKLYFTPQTTEDYLMPPFTDRYFVKNFIINRINEILSFL